MRSLYAVFVSVPFVLALSGLSPAGAAERTWIFSGAELKQAIEGSSLLMCLIRKCGGWFPSQNRAPTSPVWPI